MKKYLILIILTIALAAIITGCSTKQIQSDNLGLAILIPAQGGTGTTTAPSLNQILIGNASGAYDVKSTLGTEASPFTAVYATTVNASSSKITNLTANTLRISSYASGPMIIATSTTSGPDLIFQYDTNSGLGWTANDSLALYTGGVSRLSINSNGLVTVGNASTTQITSTNSAYLATTGGNVGVGTANPSFKLDVQGTSGNGQLKVGSADPIIFSDNYPTVGFNGYWNGANNIYYSNGYSDRIYRNSSGDLLFDTADSGTAGGTITYATKMTLLNGGNVGIGTTGPGEKLDVLGNNILIGSDFVTPTARTDATLKVGRLLIPHYTNSEEAVIAFAGATSNGANDIYYGGGSGSHNSATGLHFYTAANSTTVIGTERMTIDSVGNVGLGTASPTGKLHILQPAGTYDEANPHLSLGYGTVGIFGKMYMDGAINTVLKTYAVGGGTGYLLLDSPRIGYGVSTPAVQFHINQANGSGVNPALRISQGGTVAGVDIYEVNGDGSVYFDNIYNDANTGTYFRAQTGGTPVNVMALKSSGNVGIGTTSPAGKFEIDGGGGLGQLVLDQTAGASSYSALTFREASLARAYIFQLGSSFATANRRKNLELATDGNNGGDIAFRPLDSEVMRLTTTGNVGIGTSTPRSRLSVLGDTSNYALQVHSPSQAPYNAGFYNDTYSYTIPYLQFFGYDTGVATLGTPAAKDFMLFTNGDRTTPNLYLKSGGNVGIGSTTPNSTLTVNGNFSTQDDASSLSYFGRYSSTIKYAYLNAGNYDNDTDVSFSLRPRNSAGNLLDNALIVTNVGGVGAVGVGTSTPNNLLQINGTTATSTISATVVNGSTRSTTIGGKIILQDMNGGTCTEITAQSGVLSSRAVACP